jgi:hypothetical protein
MGTSKSRQERRKYLQLAYGAPNQQAIPAQGQTPSVNPLMQPKLAGLNVSTSVFPSNYYQEWNFTTWRAACEQVMRQSYPIQYAAMTTWVFNSSAFIQHLFREIGVGVENNPVYLYDSKGNKIEEWSEFLCAEQWFNTLRKELVYSWFWGFSVLNFDPITKEVYKYPQQNIDPINKFLRENSYNFYNGAYCKDYLNLIYVQPSTNYESFLGWMQPISRDFIAMNQNNNNWISAGERMAFPVMQVFYPENSNAQDPNSTDIDQTFNPYKLEAENIAANANPQKAHVAPYTRNPDGTIAKTIEIEYTQGTQGTAGAYRIYKDFNEQKINDIMQLILLSTLTSSVGSKGSLALGDIHMQKLEQGIKQLINWHINELNGDFLTKISQFYKNFPKGAKFGINKAKSYKMPEIKELSAILAENGKRLSTDFFIDQGISPEYIEDIATPEIEPIEKEPKEIEMATKPTLFGSLKKKVVKLSS